MSAKSIILKLCAVVAFIGCIGGGMYGVAGGLNYRDWTIFMCASALLLVGVMVVGAIVPWIAYFDGTATWQENHGRPSIAGSAFVGLMAMYCTANFLFVLAGVFLAIEDGMWGILAGAAFSLAVMIAVCIIGSMFWQISKSTKVKRNPDAVETRGVVKYVGHRFPVFVIWRSICLITELVVEIDGVKSIALVRTHSKLGRLVDENRAVTVLFDKNNAKYCFLTAVDGYVDVDDTED